MDNRTLDWVGSMNVFGGLLLVMQCRSDRLILDFRSPASKSRNVAYSQSGLFLGWCNSCLVNICSRIVKLLFRQTDFDNFHSCSPVGLGIEQSGQEIFPCALMGRDRISAKKY